MVGKEPTALYAQHRRQNDLGIQAGRADLRPSQAIRGRDKGATDGCAGHQLPDNLLSKQRSQGRRFGRERITAISRCRSGSGVQI